jgi:hypothetical protein
VAFATRISNQWVMGVEVRVGDFGHDGPDA